MGDRWEYKIIHVSAERWTSTGLPGDLNDQFDQFGADGWELVATEAITHPVGSGRRALRLGLSASSSTACRGECVGAEPGAAAEGGSMTAFPGS